MAATSQSSRVDDLPMERIAAKACLKPKNRNKEESCPKLRGTKLLVCLTMKKAGMGKLAAAALFDFVTTCFSNELCRQHCREELREHHLGKLFITTQKRDKTNNGVMEHVNS